VELRKLTATIVMSVCPSFRHMKQLGYRWPYFHEIWYWWIFRNCVDWIQVLLKCNKNSGTLHTDRCTVMLIYRWVLLRMKNISYKIVEKIKTQVLCTVHSPRPTADHITLVWPSKLCNGIELYRRVHSSFVQSIGKMMYAKRNRKLLKDSSLKYTNHTTYFTKHCQGVGETQKLWLAQSQTHQWKNF